MRRRRFLGLLAAASAAAGLPPWLATAPGAERRIGGGCDSCEAIHEGRPRVLSATVRLAPASEPGEPLDVAGTVFRADGRTPAPGVIVYLWQTDAQGLYVAAPGQRGAAARHGRLRGWLETGPGGEYAFSSIRPGSYPRQDLPAHVHVVVLEPGKNEYYLDDFVFDDDPLLTSAKRAALENRGGSGILRLQRAGGRWTGRRDLVLGRNIPNY